MIVCWYNLGTLGWTIALSSIAFLPRACWRGNGLSPLGIIITRFIHDVSPSSPCIFYLSSYDVLPSMSTIMMFYHPCLMYHRPCIFYLSSYDVLPSMSIVMMYHHPCILLSFTWCFAIHVCYNWCIVIHAWCIVIHAFYYPLHDVFPSMYVIIDVFPSMPDVSSSMPFIILYMMFCNPCML